MSRRKLEVVVDPIMCDGRGVCAELIPEWISLDPWGFPIFREGAVPAPLIDHVRRAVAACPKLALTIVENKS